MKNRFGSVLLCLLAAACQTTGGQAPVAAAAATAATGWEREVQQCVADRTPEEVKSQLASHGKAGTYVTAAGSVQKWDPGALLRQCRCEVDYIESEFTAGGRTADDFATLRELAQHDAKADELLFDAWYEAQQACR